MQMINRMRKYVILCCSLWLMACAKVKVDKNLPVLNTLKSSNSSVRLISLMGPDKVSATVGGINYNLTSGVTVNFTLNCSNGIQITSFVPTPVSLPEKVLDQSGNANVLLAVAAPFVAGGNVRYTTNVNTDTVLPDNPNNPTDYYITPATKTFGDVNYVITAVSRSATPPTVPSNIKVRIVNMASLTDTFKRTGQLTMTYADGITPVGAITTGVPVGVASEYVEIPYNTYMFRLFNQNGVEVPEAGGVSSTFHNYQPGGVYTLYVYSNPLGGCGITTNGFSVITDVRAPVNTSFGMMQFVNTIPATTYSLSLDNTNIGNAVPFRGVSGYQTMSLGIYSMRLTDQNGQTAVQQNFTINPNDNWTVWSYMKNGKPALSVTASDLSNPNGLSMRLMNFSLDVPYITYTYNGQVLPVLYNSDGQYFTYYPDINDTTSGAGASENLAIGVPAMHLPYVTPTLPLQVNKSDAGPPPFVPGVPLISVRQLQSSDITLQGVYTVALTGFVDTTLGVGMTATDTLLIVKHFK
jgi:hypothetical protein